MHTVAKCLHEYIYSTVLQYVEGVCVLVVYMYVCI